MLSQESAAGSWPVKAVEAMARICMGAEKQFEADTDFEQAKRGLARADQAIAMATMFLCEHVGVRAVVAMTESGGTARYLSRFRSAVPIYAFSHHAAARRKMALMRDVFAMDYDSRGQTPREAARGSIRLLVEAGLLNPGDRVVFTSGEHMETKGATNTLRLLEIGSDGRATGLGEL
jgi:pyruvate kinase